MLIYRQAGDDAGGKAKRLKMTMYKVTNHYGIGGESRHRNFERAVKARDSREGDGWMIVDDSGTCLDAVKLAREGGGWDIVPVPQI